MVLASSSLIQSVPPGATRRQLYKTKALVSQTSTSSKKSKSSAEVRKKSPHVTAFTFDIIGEQSKIPSPMDIACDAAREDHFERKAERERLRAEREQERVKEVARLEKHRQRLLKKRKNGTTMDIGDLANDGFVSVHTLDESSGGSNALSTGNGEREKALKSEESEWDTDCFYEDYLDTHGPPDDDCDDHLPFQAWRAEVEMKESVLLATGPCSAASAPVATAVEKSAKNTDEATLDPGSDDIAVPTVQIGVEYILRVLGVPDSASRVFIEVRIHLTSSETHAF